MNKIILLSGGLDSATLLYISLNGKDRVTPVFVNYGQKNAKNEYAAASAISESVGLKLLTVCIDDVFKLSNSAMLNQNSRELCCIVKNGSHSEILSENTEIEFRNGVLLSIGISLAMQLYKGEETEVSYGAAKTRCGFKDCDKKFVALYDSLARYCTNGKVQVTAPLANKGKDEIMALAKSIGVPIYKTWSCYNGGEKPCGICPACLDRKILEGIDANI